MSAKKSSEDTVQIFFSDDGIVFDLWIALSTNNLIYVAESGRYCLVLTSLLCNDSHCC